MNYRMYDGTVRCAEHMDAASYQGTTGDECTYCAARPGSEAPVVHRFEAILSHPESPDEGVLAHIDATSRGWAHSEAIRCVNEPGNLWYGYQFTIWPDPVQAG